MLAKRGRERALGELAAQDQVQPPEGWATRLIFPTAFSLINFMWHSQFGYILCSSGFVNGLAIVALLRKTPSRSTRLLGAGLGALGGLFNAVAFTWFLWFQIDPTSYFKMDPIMMQMIVGIYDEDGLIQPIDSIFEEFTGLGLDQRGVDALIGSTYEEDRMRWPACWVLIVLYLCQFPITLMIDACMVVACIRTPSPAKGNQIEPEAEPEAEAKTEPKPQPEPLPFRQASPTKPEGDDTARNEGA